MRTISAAVVVILTLFGTLTHASAITASEREESRHSSVKDLPRATPPGFKVPSTRKTSAILRSLSRAGVISNPQSRCWSVFVTRTDAKWGSLRPLNASGCQSGEGLTAIRKTRSGWTSLSIAGSSLPCSYLADELRRKGAPPGVVRDFTQGWPCI